VQAADADTSIVILSDHGHGPLYEFIHANNLLIEAGIMRVKKALRSRLKHALFRMGFTPLNVYKAGNALGLAKLRMGLRWTSKGYGMLRTMFFSFSDIDWPRTTGYAISGGVYGGAFMNLEGREPEGMVPSERYGEAREELTAVLSRLRHPRDGGQLIAKVLKREDIYKGKFAAEGPDLFFLPRDASIGVFGDFEFSSNRIVEGASPAISAQHRMEGVFIAAGKEIKQNFEIEGMRVIDVAPLLFHLMGMPIPEGLDGKLREDALAEASIEKRPPAYFKLKELLDVERRGRHTMEDDSIKERLKGLGYIS
jgi:predicted AlkP superfamily phosphohydrolase/phosphomutase